MECGCDDETLQAARVSIWTPDSDSRGSEPSPSCLSFVLKNLGFLSLSFLNYKMAIIIVPFHQC